MLVELLGLPGSGKSTIAGIVERSRIEGIAIEVPRGALHALNAPGARESQGLAQRAVAAATALLRFPALAWSLLRVRAAALGWSAISPRILFTFLLESEAFICAGRLARGVTVLEEGPLQWMFTLTFGGDVGRARTCIRRYLRRIYGDVDVAFFYLQAPPDLCVSRLAQRDQDASTFNRNSGASVMARLRAYPFPVLLEELRSATDATLLTADARKPAAETAVELERFIAARADGRSGQ